MNPGLVVINLQQWLAIGRFLHVYLDDIFIFSDTLDEHEKHLTYVFQKLQESRLYIEKAKCDLYSESMDCLGHLLSFSRDRAARDFQSVSFARIFDEL